MEFFKNLHCLESKLFLFYFSDKNLIQSLKENNRMFSRENVKMNEVKLEFFDAKLDLTCLLSYITYTFKLWQQILVLLLYSE